MAARKRAMEARITHTINVVENNRGYWGSSKESCVTKYVIWVILADGVEWQVARRYSQFRSNHAALTSMFAQLRLPKLPPKIISMEQLSSSKAVAPPDPEVVASRMVHLDTYLKQLLGLAAVATCTQMRTFLGAYQGMPLPYFGAMQQRTSFITDEAEASARSSRDDDTVAALTFGSMSPRHDARAAAALIADLGLPLNVDAFAAQLDTAQFRAGADAAVAMAHRFLNGMEAAIAISSQPTGAGGGAAAYDGACSAANACAPAPPHDYVNGALAEGVLWAARDQLEDRLMHALHDAVFCALPEEALRDTECAANLGRLEKVLAAPEEQLDVHAVFCDNRFNRWDAAASELCKLADVRTPRAKMDCVMRCVLQLKQGLVECLAAQGGGTGVALGADELFPVFVLQRTGSDPPPALSREELAQRRASSVEDAESIWARQIESSLLGSQRPSEHPSEGVLSRQGSAAAGSASLGSSGGGLLSVDELEAVLAAAADAADAAALELE